jgi:hypothetical protein
MSNKKDISKEPETKKLKRMIRDGELDPERTVEHLKGGEMGKGYKSSDELAIYPGLFIYKVYQRFCEGKTAEQIHEELKSEMEKEMAKGDNLRLIERFQEKMKRG